MGNGCYYRRAVWLNIGKKRQFMNTLKNKNLPKGVLISKMKSTKKQSRYQ